MSAGTITWDKPGPGAWTYDAAHNVGPVSPIVQAAFPDAMADGFRSFTGRYGMMLSHIEVRYVNGFAYGAVRLAGVPASDRRPPPDPVLRLVVRLHPEFRRRNRQARVALDRRVWRDDLRRWFDELRPARLASIRALQAIDPTTLADGDVAEHLDACVAELDAGLREHFSLVGAAGLPVGLYVLREAERGRPASEAIADLAGAAEQSTGATLPALSAIADALDRAGVEPATLDDVRRASPDAAAALDAYLGDYGNRVVGAFDVTGRRLVELPDVVLRSIVGARGRRVLATPAPPDDDPVAADAHLAVASRDDHSGICCMWPLGLTRRALLAVGERLHGAGLIEDPDHVLDATSSEVRALLDRSPDAPTAGELAAPRRASRAQALSLTPPPVLGEAVAPPDPSLLPTGLRRIAAAMAAFLGALETEDSGRVARDGVGVGTESYRGHVVVAVDAEDAISRLQPGDVLITSTTTTAFNAVLPMVGALVTAHGGLMSHAGIAARELGIPAVLGVVDALDRIADGAEVEVDPVAATVRVVQPANRSA